LLLFIIFLIWKSLYERGIDLDVKTGTGRYLTKKQFLICEYRYRIITGALSTPSAALTLQLFCVIA